MSGTQKSLIGAGAAPHPTGTLNGTSAFRTTANASSYAMTTYAPVKVVQPGAVTAATLKTILSLSGSGVVSFLGVESADATSRTHRIKVTLDGTVIFDATSGAITTVSSTLLVIGALSNDVASTTSNLTLEPLSFNSALVIEYASSLSETDKTYIGYRYYPT